MRLAIDGRFIHDHFPGIGRYTYNLARALADQAPGDTLLIIHNPRLPNTRYDLAVLCTRPNVQMVETEAAPFSLSEQWQLPRLARGLKLDAWHAPYYIGPYRLPCPLVVTIHDAISSRYPRDLPSLAARLSYETTMRLAMGAARRVIAVSQASRADLVRFFGVAPQCVAVVHEAADERYRPQRLDAVADVRGRLGLPERYVLYVGMNKPHKNLERLVQAWAGLPGARDGSEHLVIAGRSDPRYPGARSLASQLGLADSVIFSGDVAEADLPALYSGATLFVFPSLYEGFGLPVLEAMACGAPVVCSSTPALLEVAGDAALTFDPLEVVAQTAALDRALSDPELRVRLRQHGLARAHQFSWQRAARETRNAYVTASRL